MYMLSDLLHLSENGVYGEFFKFGLMHKTSQSLINVASQNWTIDDLVEIASSFNIKTPQ